MPDLLSTAANRTAWRTKAASSALVSPRRLQKTRAWVSDKLRGWDIFSCFSEHATAQRQFSYAKLGRGELNYQVLGVPDNCSITGGLGDFGGDRLRQILSANITMVRKGANTFDQAFICQDTCCLQKNSSWQIIICPQLSGLMKRRPHH